MSASTTQPTTPKSSVTTYRAAVVPKFHAPLTVKQVPAPELDAGQVRVKVEASGLCHTDIHAAHGDWPVKPSPPFIPGHEGVGIVAELGPGVSEVAVGDRVAMPWLGYARHLRPLRVRLGDALPAAEEHGLLDRRRLRRVCGRIRPLRRKGARRDRPARRRAGHLRGRNDLQGRESRRDALLRSGRGVRRRRSRPPRHPVCGDRRRARDRRRSRRREAPAGGRAGR
jgi:Alcohol dehydrogenase GroES-like domain